MHIGLCPPVLPWQHRCLHFLNARVTGKRFWETEGFPLRIAGKIPLYFMNHHLPEAFLWTALKNDSHTLTFLVSHQGKLLEVNQAFARLTGYIPAGDGEKLLWDFLSAGDAEITKPVFASGITASCCFSQQWQSQSGERIYVDWSAYPYPDSTGHTCLLCIGRDVTMHKARQEDLLIKEAWLDRIQEISDTGYWEHDLQSDVLRYSRQTARIYNLPAEQSELDHDQLGVRILESPYSMEKLLELIVPQEREEFMIKMQGLLKAQLPYEIVYSMETDGNKRRIQAIAEFIHDPEGKAIRLAGISRDITRQYEHEKQLQYKEKLLDSVSEAIVATDADLNITGWNKGAERVYGWKAGEVLGKNAAAILQTTLWHETPAAQAFHQLLEQGYFRNRVIQRHRNGTPIHIFSNSSKLFDEQNRLEGFVGLNQDIGQLVQLEEEVLSYQTRLKIILDNSPDSIFLTDTEGRILIMNNTFQRLFYERFGRKLGKEAKMPDIFPPPVQAAAQLNLNRALEGESFTYEHVYLDKDGNKQIAETSACPVLDSSGKVSGVVFYTRSITLRRKIEEQTISDTVEAQKAKAALLVEGQEMERARLVKDLHDGIGQMLNVLKLKIDSWLDKSGAEKQELAAISDFTSQIIADIKNLVQDSMPYQLEHLGLAGAIRNLVAQYEQQPEIKIVFNVWVNLIEQGFGKSTEVFIFRVLQECLHNAIKHSKCTQITVQLTQLEGELLLMVEDNGVGFDPAQVLRGKQSYGGLRNILERSNLAGADLEIDTRPGHGCTINIRIPLQAHDRRMQAD
jgi:PAS domain S-box-containing protein